MTLHCLLVVAFTAMQFFSAHIHLASSHEHDGDSHSHIIAHNHALTSHHLDSFVSPLNPISHHLDSFDAPIKHADNKVVHLSEDYAPQSRGDLKNLVLLQANALWPSIAVKRSHSHSFYTFDFSQLNWLSYSTIYLRAPPKLTV